MALLDVSTTSSASVGPGGSGGRHATLGTQLVAVSQPQRESGQVRALAGHPLPGFAPPPQPTPESGQVDVPAGDAWFARERW